MASQEEAERRHGMVDSFTATATRSLGLRGDLRKLPDPLPKTQRNHFRRMFKICVF